MLSFHKLEIFNLNFLYFFLSAQNKSENSNKTGTRQLGNQVIRKGHMVIQNLGIMKGLYPFFNYRFRRRTTLK